MIPFELSFRRAESVDEAVGAWAEATEAGQTALYYGGGTEIVTLGRDHKRQADVLIDYKRIPETWVLGTDADADTDTDAAEVWQVGASVRLNTVIDTPQTGLLAYCFSGVADRTVRNSVTVGGNICGMLAYREAVLPFLLLDGTVTYAHPADATATGEVEVTTRPINELFHKRLQLPKGGLALSFGIDRSVLADLGLGATGAGTASSGEGLRTGSGGYLVTSPYGAVTAAGGGPEGKWFYRRRTKDPRIDYPLVTVAMALVGGAVRVAVAGAWGYPVRADRVEEVINATGAEPIAKMDAAARRGEIERAVDEQALQFKKDMRGSRRYRRELTIQAVEDGILALTGDRGGTA